MTTQTPIDPRHARAQQKAHVEVYWKAVTDKTVVGYGCLGVAMLFGGMYRAKPDWSSSVYKKFANAVKNAVSNSTSDADPVGTDQKHAKFVNLDGKVEVKKVNSVKWADADFRTSLDKGDQIKTGPDGDARITFADGTTYTMKPDSLVVVEENSTESNRPSSSGIGITTGTVDWATPTWTLAESKAQVRVEDTKAQLGSNSRGAVKADPENKSSEIVVSSGTGQGQRDTGTIDVCQLEKETSTEHA